MIEKLYGYNFKSDRVFQNLNSALKRVMGKREKKYTCNA